MKQDKAAILIKKASLELDKISDPTLEKYDMGISQYKVMKYIYSEYENGVRLVDLEKYFSMTHPTAIGLVQNLEKKGLVEYRDNPHHARSRLIYPTEKALSIRSELDDVGDRVEDEFTKRLNAKERKQLIDLLIRMMGIEDGQA